MHTDNRAGKGCLQANTAKKVACALSIGIVSIVGVANASISEPATHLLPTRLPKGYRLVKPDDRRYPSLVRDDGLTIRTLFLTDGLELSEERQAQIGPAGSGSCASRLEELGEVETSVVYKNLEIVPSIEPYAKQVAYYCSRQIGTPAKLTIQGDPGRSESFRSLLNEHITTGGQLLAERTFTQTFLTNFDFGVARYRFGSRTIEFRVQRCKPSRLFDQPTGTFADVTTGRGVLTSETLAWRPEPDVCATVQAPGLDPKQLLEIAKSTRRASTRIWEAATGKWRGDFPPTVSPP
jgi:hypothetical protein